MFEVGDIVEVPIKSQWNKYCNGVIIRLPLPYNDDISYKTSR